MKWVSAPEPLKYNSTEKGRSIETKFAFSGESKSECNLSKDGCDDASKIKQPVNGCPHTLEESVKVCQIGIHTAPESTQIRFTEEIG